MRLIGLVVMVVACFQESITLSLLGLGLVLVGSRSWL